MLVVRGSAGDCGSWERGPSGRADAAAPGTGRTEAEGATSGGLAFGGILALDGIALGDGARDGGARDWGAAGLVGVSRAEGCGVVAGFAGLRLASA